MGKYNAPNAAVLKNPVSFSEGPSYLVLKEPLVLGSPIDLSPLVLNDLRVFWSKGGWTAEIDGHPQPIFRANAYFRAVRLEPGESQVLFRYQPQSVRLGLILSLLAWLGWAACFAIAISHIGRKSPYEV